MGSCLNSYIKQEPNKKIVSIFLPTRGRSAGLNMHNMHLHKICESLGLQLCYMQFTYKFIMLHKLKCLMVISVASVTITVATRGHAQQQASCMKDRDSEDGWTDLSVNMLFSGDLESFFFFSF